MLTYDLKNEIKDLKKLMYFNEVIGNLAPRPPKKSPDTYIDEDIPVILSTDQNYVPYLAVTGVSILANTDHHISFYIIDDGIGEANKLKIEQAFKNVTDNFSIRFFKCDARQQFTGVKIDRGTYLTISAFNRLIFPMLCPEVERAIYLDVDLIVLGDIADLWHTDLGNNFLGACPIYVELDVTISACHRWACIPEEPLYRYFNSGVLLLDYKKWREVAGGNEKLIEHVFKTVASVDTSYSCDEVVLNHLAYEYGSYKELDHRFNVYCFPYYKYLRDKKKLSPEEAHILEEINAHIRKYGYEEVAAAVPDICIRHFATGQKPWKDAQWNLFGFREAPIMANFRDYWRFASYTPFFNEMKDNFYACNMGDKVCEIDGKNITRAAKNLILYLLTGGLVKKYLKKLDEHLSKIFS